MSTKQVDLTMVYDRLEAVYRTLPKAQATEAQAIKGILLRLKTFRYGQLAAMYGRGEGSLAVEDLGLPHGLVILEGGHMPEYAKAVVLSLIAWHLYQDAVIRRRESIGQEKQTPMFLVFEEGNKIISGIPDRASDDRRPGQASEIFQSMFRDAGKYNIFLEFYHLLAHEMKDQGATRRVMAVNVDAAIATVWLSITWPLLKENRITEMRAIDIPFLAFALGRSAGGGAEFLDHQDHGEQMDMRVPVSECLSYTRDREFKEE